MSAVMQFDAMKARTNAQTRGRRLLIEGRLSVESARVGRVFASVRGDSGASYKCGYKRPRFWCDCPARGTCAHIVALQLVVDTTRLSGAA